jgi:hypothetical protein
VGDVVSGGDVVVFVVFVVDSIGDTDNPVLFNTPSLLFPPKDPDWSVLS